MDDVGALVAASTAIMLSFKGRQKWEPCEEDIPKGAVKVVGALTAAGIALLWFNSKSSYEPNFYFSLAIVFSVILFVGFLVYVLLVNQYTYDRRENKIIGGIRLTPEAVEILRDKSNGSSTIQRLLDGAERIDQVWPRLSRGMSKISFLVAYFAVVIGGCLALAVASIISNYSLIWNGNMMTPIFHVNESYS